MIWGDWFGRKGKNELQHAIVETQTALIGEPENKDVGKPVAKGKTNGRFETYKQAIRNLGNQSGREILSVGESSGRTDTASEGTGEEGERLFDYPANTIAQRDHKGGGQLMQEPSIVQLNNPTHSNNRLYSPEGVSPTINTAQGGNRQPKIAIPVLTPNRAEKRQHGRRFKTDGEPSFTLTGQDIHGIMTIEPSTHIVIHSLYPRSSKTGEGGTGHLSKEDDTTYCIDTGNTQAIAIKPVQDSQARIRKLTPTECERLQSFPDGWTKYGKKGKNVVEISSSQRYKMCGNAVTVNVVEEIIKSVG